MDPFLIIRIAAFILGTIFIILISKRSLQSVRYHGFYRFFVFEFILVLILTNITHWFDYPFTLQQIISWSLLFVSFFLLVESLYFFKKYGAAKQRRNSTGNFEFEDTSSLIQEGIYKYIRHPMYGSLLFLALGAMFKDITVVTVLLNSVALVFIFLTAKIEEKENLEFFGPDYEDYIKRSKMFIPFII